MNGFQESPMLEDVPIANLTILIGRKRCTKCELTKNIIEFSRQKGSKDGLRSQCRVCQSIAAKKYYKANREKIVGYQATNRKKIAAQRKKSRTANREKIAAQRKKYYKANREKEAARVKKYHQTKAGKAVQRKADHKRTALKKNVDYESFYPIEILKRDRYICQLCGRKTRPDYNQYHPLYPNLDHIVPLSLKGSHTRQNTQCLCRLCNITKNNTGTGDQLRMFG